MPSRQKKKRAKRRAKYLEVRDDVLESARASYKADPEKKRTGERERYHADPVKKRSAKRESYEAYYSRNVAYTSWPARLRPRMCSESSEMTGGRASFSASHGRDLHVPGYVYAYKTSGYETT